MRCTARPTGRSTSSGTAWPGDVTFKTVAGSGILFNAGAVLILYCDGTNVIQLAGLVATINDIGDVVITAAASGQMLRFDGSSWVNEDSPYDVGMFIPGTQGNGALMAQVVLTRALSFADDFAGARAYAGVGATATQTGCQSRLSVDFVVGRPKTTK